MQRIQDNLFKRLWQGVGAALVLLLFSSLGWGQGAFYQFDRPYPNVTFRVCPLGVSNPCPNPTPIFTDQGLSQPIVQPVNVGSDGAYGFWVASGQYLIQLSGTFNRSFIISAGGGGGLPAVCNANTQQGADLGAQINACDAVLGVNPGNIYAANGGAIGTQIVVSSTHVLSLGPGTYTNAFTNRTPAFRLQDHSKLLCQSRGAILQQSSNNGQSTPVTVAAYNVGPTVNTITATVTDIEVDGCHFTQGPTTNNSPFIGILTLGNCINCITNDNWFDGVQSIGLLIGGTSTNGFFADTWEAKGNIWNGGGVNVPLAVINGKNIYIHHNTFKAPGSGAAAPIDLEPNATTDYSENIDVSNNIIDASAATTTTFGITVQGNAGTHINQHIKIHDNIIFGAEIPSGVFMNQAIAIGPGSVGTFNDFEIYNNMIYKASANGIALNGVNRAWVHDNKIFCVNTSQGAGVPTVIQLSGNDTNNLIERNYNANDGSCPGANSTNAYGESSTGNSNNTFRFNIAPFPTVVSGTGSTQNDPGTVANVNTAGQGFFYGGMPGATLGLPGITGITNAVIVASANQVRAIQFVLPEAATISHITWITVAGAGDTVDFGLYSADRSTKILESGATVSVGAAAAQTVTLSTPVPLQPGTYWFAWTQTGTPTTTFQDIPTPSTSINMNSVVAKFGLAANAASAGTLPASLGTITGNPGFTIPNVLFEP